MNSFTVYSSSSSTAAKTRTLKALAGKVLRPLVRACTQHLARVLMYHRFSRGDEFRQLRIDAFEAHLKYLVKHYRPARLADVAAHFAARKPLPPRTVAITVDDGYKDFYDVAYPILRQYKVPATVYVVTEFVGGGFWLWFDAIHWLVHAAAPGRYEITSIGKRIVTELNDAGSRNALWEAVADSVITMHAGNRWTAIQGLAAALSLQLPPTPTSEYAAMTWDEVRKLDRNLIEVGAHTRTHPILSACSPQEQEQEILGSKREIETQLGSPVNAFCYPNGQATDFTQHTVDIVKHCAFDNAVLAYGGIADASDDVLKIPRISPPDDIEQFRNSIDGLERLMQGIKGRLR